MKDVNVKRGISQSSISMTVMDPITKAVDV